MTHPSYRAAPLATAASSTASTKRQRFRRGLGARGAVLVELLIAYIPVLFCFLAFWQLSELLVAQMVVARASSAAGRAAVVVLPDDPVFYAGEAPNTLGGKREADVRLAAGMILAASPHLAEDFNLYIGNLPEDVGVVEVSVAANFRCDRLRFVCGADGVVHLSATSQHTYHGAKYQYEPTNPLDSAVASRELYASGDASCQDGDPAVNGSGAKPGKGDDGTGGAGKGGRGGSGGEGSTRNGGGLCGPGATQNANGSCTPNQCAKETNERKRKRCEDEQPCKAGETKDSFGKCCANPQRQRAPSGAWSSFTSCEACTPQEAAPKEKDRQKLTGTIEVGGSKVQLPAGILPNTKNICGATCESPGSESPEDIVVDILTGLERKSLEYLCTNNAAGTRNDVAMKERRDQDNAKKGITDTSYDGFFAATAAWCSARVANPNDPGLPALYTQVHARMQELTPRQRANLRTALRNGASMYHTEPKVIEFMEQWSNEQDIDLNGINMDLRGSWSPCASCGPLLQSLVNEHGGEVTYCWTLGIYQTGDARNGPFVLDDGKLQGGGVRHQGCVTYKPNVAPSYTSNGPPLCPDPGKKSK